MTDLVPQVNRAARLMMLAPLVSATFVLVILVQASGAFSWDTWTGERLEFDGLRDLVMAGIGTVGSGFLLPAFTAWNQLSSLALLVVVVPTARRWPKGMPAVVIGGLVHPALLVSYLADTVTSQSSTAALALLFIPVHLLAVIALTALGAVFTHQVRTRTRVG